MKENFWNSLFQDVYSLKMLLKDFAIINKEIPSEVKDLYLLLTDSNKKRISLSKV